MDEISEYLNSVRATLSRLNTEEVRSLIGVLFQAWREERTIFIVGNGGSSATASHMVNDLNKGAAVPGQQRFRAMALTDNVPLLTAWANDTAYEDVFAEQLRNFARPRDILVAISGSGNSPNVLNAVRAARQAGCLTIGLTGFGGGRLKDLVDPCLVVPSDCMETIEDVHLVLEHCICRSLRGLIARHASRHPVSDAAVVVGGG